ncbi:succinyl-CoA:glutarate CoA-transferase-like [Saccoglossus kowalevskii]|uniref:Succinate--hydroxymethylglutarate CoA-transferase-like n=1 Tax=Saccoglossus kowalevskii TaxID=10224 RepID=A0ABM0GPY5_SACKO|nr:PREDICTED: succinate--hydroxymethylglutarate CoA-transferase-like [Saccoglossus kowalevskii]
MACCRFTMLTRPVKLSRLWRQVGSAISRDWVVKRRYSTGGSTQAMGALDGIRVLDLTRVLAGPFATMILGDLGAEIIKIEKPGVGDETRTWGPPFVDSQSCYFLSINRNKKSLAVDLKDPRGKQIIIELAKKCDVLVENYVPGKLTSMGLGYEDLHKVAPQLIYCSISGYGSDGPYAERAGYDVVAASMAGLLHITGPQDGEPARVGVAMTDLSTGLYSHGAIMAALLQRYKTGKGQKIECNLLSTQVALLTHIAGNYLNAGVEAKRWGTGHGSIVPYQAFKTKDGFYLIVGAGNDKHFSIVCKLLSLEFLLEDNRYKGNHMRVENRNTLITTMSDRFSQKSLKEWLDIFEGCGIPYGPINNMQQVFNDPQVQHNNMVQEVQHATVGNVRMTGPAVKYSDSDNSIHLPPPLLGQHSKEVLQDLLEYDENEVADLIDNHIVASCKDQ